MADDLTITPPENLPVVQKRMQVRERVRRHRQRRRDGLLYIPGLLLPDVPLEMMLSKRGFLASDSDDGDAIAAAVEKFLLAEIIESETEL